jgi:hypothetical protein
VQVPKHPGGRPKGKTDLTGRNFKDLSDMLHAIKGRVVAGQQTWCDTQDLRTIVPALTPIMTANIEMIDARPALDIEELMKFAASNAPALPPALAAPAGPDLALTPIGIHKPDDE